MRSIHRFAFPSLVGATSLAISACMPPVGVQLATGGSANTCASLFDGRLLCWGDNTYGQLGIGNQTASLTPVGMPPFAFAPPSHPAIIGIAEGENHTCVIGPGSPGGKIFCVGSNSDGQLGVDSHVDYAFLQPARTTLTKPDGTPRLAQLIAAGRSHTCAVYEGGLVACWGRGSPLQPTLVSTSTAAPGVVMPLFAKAIAARYDHTCVVQTDAQVACWFVAFGAAPAPTIVAGLLAKGVIAVGRNHACVTDLVGAIQCWGSNSRGQLGNGSSFPGYYTPVTVTTHSTSAVLALAAGDDHTCALFVSGSVECWGANDSGQTGDPALSAKTLTPFQVIASGATAIAAGGTHSCAAIFQNGVRHLNCWGLNLSGQLGDGTMTSATAPVLVHGIP